MIGIGLAFISFLLCGQILITSPVGTCKDLTHLSTPQGAFGETPFDSANCLQDPEFNEGENHWNYTSGAHISAKDDSIIQQGNLSTYSASVVGKQNLAPSYAEYRGGEVTTALTNNNDGLTTSLTFGLLETRANLNVNFSESLSDGCIITMKFTSGSSTDVTIYDYDSTTPAAGYGSATYAGGVQSLNITLIGMSKSKRSLNLFVSVPLLGTIVLDQVIGYIPPTQFQECANIKQSLALPQAENLSYSLNFTYAVSQFQSIDQAVLRAQINATELWQANITGTSAYLGNSVSLPRTLLQLGGNFEVVFNLSLNVNTFEEVKFRLFLDNVFLLRTPVLNLLEDPECNSGIPWDTSQAAANYSLSWDYSAQSFLCKTNTSGRSGWEFADGWVSLKQDFQKNLTQENYQFSLDLKLTNLTGVDHANLTVQINDTIICMEKIRDTSQSWQHLWWNATTALQVNGNYTLNITLSIKLTDPHPAVGWECFLDNIFLYPLWNSSLTQLGGLYDGNVTAGEQKEIWFNYTMTEGGLPIPDAEVIVHNNDTGNEWGLDFSINRKYIVTNFQNGTYSVSIISQGCNVGLYNLSVSFLRANFPCTSLDLPLNVSGSLLSIQYTYGAHYNLTYNMWFVNDDNTPYVNDSTSRISFLVIDSLTFSPLDNAFVEAWCGANNFLWQERYKQTQNLADIGYYDVYINTTGLNPAHEYLVHNFTFLVSAQGYNANISFLSTRINPLPSSLYVPNIDPFYEGSIPEITAIFQDTFNIDSIDGAVVTWEIEGTPCTGQLQFLTFGYYMGSLSTTGLTAGTYDLQVTGQKSGYVSGYTEVQIQVLPKWNVSTVLVLPAEFVEGNQYSLTYNFTYNETGQPIIGVQIDIKVQFEGVSGDENYVLFTSSKGQISLTLDIPTSATSIGLNATFGGSYNINAMSLNFSASIRQKLVVQLVLVNFEIPTSLIGDSNLELRARLTYSNKTGISGVSLVFSMGSSEATTLTDENGYANVILRVPSEGSFTVSVVYVGSSTIRTVSTATAPITVTSIAKTAVIIIVIIGTIIVMGYLTLDRGIIRPRQRKRNLRMKELTRRFDDAKNYLMLMLIDNESGVEAYSTSFSAIPVDPTLVSGFLTAIGSFGQDLLSEDTITKLKGPKAKKVTIKRSLREINYHHFKILMQETGALRVALIVLESPSPRGLENFQEFARQAEMRFGPTMPTRGGIQIEDDEVWDLIEEYFELALTYTHVLDSEVESTASLSRWERIVSDHLKEAPFYGSASLPKLQEELAYLFPGKDLEILERIFTLRQKRVFLPIPKKFVEFYLSAEDTLQNLLDVQKQLILQVGGGEHNPNQLQRLSQVDQNQFENIVHPLHDVGILTPNYDLSIPGKILLAILKYKASKGGMQL